MQVAISAVMASGFVNFRPTNFNITAADNGLHEVKNISTELIKWLKTMASGMVIELKTYFMHSFKKNVVSTIV